MKVWIAEVFFDGKYYASEAGETVGKPLLSQEVFVNRRTLDGVLTTEGKTKLQEIRRQLSVLLHIPNHMLYAKFDRYCGCSMCPCSPGYKVFAEVPASSWRTKEDYRFNIWVNENGKIDLRNPEYTSWVNGLFKVELESRRRR